MANIRNVVLAPGEIYHIFNRGVERRIIFSDRREYQRGLESLNYYRFSNLPVRYSHFLNLNADQKQNIQKVLDETEVTILAYCLMPNHFHLVLRQEKDKGISRFLSNFTNSYSRYFNIKNQRVGPLFQGSFKAVRIETDEQLLHVSRYVHLNPVTSFLIKEKFLDNYEWSSLPEYLNSTDRNISEPKIILGQFKDKSDYRRFVYDRINYKREFGKVKHLSIDEV